MVPPGQRASGQIHRRRRQINRTGAPKAGMSCKIRCWRPCPWATNPHTLHPSRSEAVSTVMVRPRWSRTHSMGCRSEEHTSELQSRGHLVCRLLLEKKKTIQIAEPELAEEYTSDTSAHVQL